MTDTRKIDIPNVSSVQIVSAEGYAGKDWARFFINLATKVNNIDLSRLSGTGFVVKTSDTSYVVRTLTGTANQVLIQNGSGVGAAPVFSLPQDIDDSATPEFASVLLSALTPSRLIYANASKIIASADLASWIASVSANQVIVTDNGDGTITLSLPQNIDTDADVVFDTATIDALHLLDTNASHDMVLVCGEDLTADRTMTFLLGDAARQITLSGNPTLADWFNQNVKDSAKPTFAGANFTAGVGFGTATPGGVADFSPGTTGGLFINAMEAAVDITAAATITIQANVPSGAKLLGSQLRVDSALAGGETWNAQYVTGATQSICTAQAVAKNTKVSTFFNENSATPIAAAEVDITIQRSSNPGVDVFTPQGNIRAIVYYQAWTAMADAG